MKTFLTLYRKELKKLMAIALILGVYVGCISLYHVYKFYFIQDRISYLPGLVKKYIIYSGDYPIYFMITSVPYILAVILAYSLIIEHITLSRYQLLSLPVHPSYIMISKLIAAFTIGLIPVLIRNSIFNPYLFFLRHHLEFQSYYHPAAGVRTMVTRVLFSFSFSWYSFEYYAVLFGIICAAHGISMIFKRHRPFLWVLTFISCQCVIYWPLRRFIRPVFGTIGYDYYPLLCGIIFMIVGSVLYGKYSEV